MEENSESLSFINKPATLVAGHIGLMIPSRAGVYKKDAKGSVVSRKEYFESGENIIGIGICRMLSNDYKTYQYGHAVFPEKVENTPFLRELWGKDYHSGRADKRLLEEFYQKYKSKGLTVHKVQLALSVKHEKEAEDFEYGKISELLGKTYGSLEMEMAWFLAHGEKKGKPTAGAYAISDRSGEKFGPFEAYHKLTNAIHKGASDLLKSAVELFVE